MTTANPDMDLSIIVVSYNTREITLDCLRSVRAFPPSVAYEVIIVDNASSDGSFSAIQNEFPEFRSIGLDKNVGFAAGNNRAAEYATGKRILLLNPDTVVNSATFSEIWGFSERAPYRRIWGGRTFFPDGSLNKSSCWRSITLRSLFMNAVGLTHMWPDSDLFNPETYGDWPRDTERSVDIVSGCFFLIDANLWRTLEGFDETFFMYAEEADLCLRAKAVGARPGITPNATLIHIGGASTASSVKKLTSVMAARITLMRKHWSGVKFRAGMSLILLWVFIRLILSRFRAGRQDAPGESREKWLSIWRRRDEWLAGL